MNTIDRFSDRVENYVKYRPHYPQKLIDYLLEDDVLLPNSVIADIGSGTGISAIPFLDNGNKVFGVEPNIEMRETAEKVLAPYKRFISIDGTAEATNLAKKSVHIIVAGQAFHWFNLTEAKKEFKRIAKTNGVLILMWNVIAKQGPLMSAYHRFRTQFGKNYPTIEQSHTKITDIKDFYAPATFDAIETDNYQYLSWEGLKGRTLSSSFMPNENADIYPEMILTLEKIFDQFQEDGIVSLKYNTTMYVGRVK